MCVCVRESACVCVCLSEGVCVCVCVCALPQGFERELGQWWCHALSMLTYLTKNGRAIVGLTEETSVSTKERDVRTKQ